MARFVWNRGPVGLPDRPSQTGALSPSWLFLQRNNSQTHNCRYKYEDFCGPCDPMHGFLAKRRAGPSRTNIGTLFHLF
jgi:hypothetical protein